MSIAKPSYPVRVTLLNSRLELNQPTWWSTQGAGAEDTPTTAAARAYAHLLHALRNAARAGYRTDDLFGLREHLTADLFRHHPPPV
jgi:hypothetical protein